MGNLVANSLAEYIEIVKSIYHEWDCHNHSTLPWYRGHANKDWNLVPGIYRNELSHFEREINRDFRLNARTFLDHQPESEFEWLFIMQHYGTPTRLLDWSENHLTALFFAVQDLSINTDACVWMMHPWSLNSCNLEFDDDDAIWKTVPVSNHPSIEEGYLLGSSNPVLKNGVLDISRNVSKGFPIAIRPIRKTNRIIAQKGTFTIHGHHSDPLDELMEPKKQDENGKMILKILLPNHVRRKILKELYIAGITHSVLFPEIEGISKDLVFRYSDKFFGERIDDLT